MTLVKNNFELDLLILLKKGLSPKEIAKQLNVSLPMLSYHLSKLKDNGQIKKIGKIYQVETLGELKSLSQDTPPSPKDIRGHAFIWKIRFNKLINWKELLIKNQVNYDELGTYSTPRIILNNKKIWLGKENVVVYFNKNDSFFAFNSIESKKLAIYTLLELISSLEHTLNTNLGHYKFTCSREHYSLINNSLAIQCDKEGKKINIKNEEGFWMSIDNSLNLHEAEAISKDSQLDIIGIQKYFNSHKNTQFKVTPEFVLNVMNGIQSNQLIFAENMKSHIEAIQSLSKGVNKLTKIVGGLIIENKELKLSKLHQKTLGDFK